MTGQEIFEKLRAMVDDIKGDIEVTMDTALIESQIMDSLELINYLTQIEEVFDLNITMDELIEHQLGKISNMVEYIAKKI